MSNTKNLDALQSSEKIKPPPPKEEIAAAVRDQVTSQVGEQTPDVEADIFARQFFGHTRMGRKMQQQEAARRAVYNKANSKFTT